MSFPVTQSPWFDTLQQLKSEIYKGLRVCLPGSIAAVNSDGTVNVTVGVKQNQAQKGFPQGLPISYPTLTMCPVISIQGGGVGAVMPIKVKDECLVIFSDRNIEAWFQTGQPMPLPDLRMHDITDGFVLVGLNSQANPLNTSLDVGEGGLCETKTGSGAKVAINPVLHKVAIANDTSDLLTAVTALTTALSTLTVNISTGLITPASVSAINAALVQFQALLY